MRRPIFTILLIILTVSFAVSCQHRGSDDYLSNINLEDSTVIMHADQAYDDFERFYYNNELDSMLEIAPITLKLLEKAEDWFDYYYVWKIKIGVLTQLGDYTKATEEADTMFANATERKNDFGLSMANYAMSEIYGMQENPAEATKFAAKAVDLFPKDLEPGDLLGMYANYCYSAIITNDKVGLDTMFTQWKAIVDKYPCKSDDPDLKNHANWHFMYLYHRSLAWAATGEVKQAEQLIDSLYYYENLEGNYFQQKALITLVQMQIALHKEDYATMLALTDSFELAGVKMNDNTKIVEALDQRSNAFAELGRWKDAYETLLKCKTRNDSIILADNREQLNALNKRFEVNELKMEGERQQMQAERRQLYLVIAIVLLVLVGTVLFAYYRRRTDRRMTAVTAEKERIENELQIARDIQMSMVPSQFPDREGLDMFASMTPAKEVGGDLYGYVLLGDKLYFAVGDVSGKGVPASLFMAQATRLFRTLAAQGMMPAEICTSINKALSGDDNENGMFVTFFLGLIDLKTGHLDFCNAGHNPPVIGGGEHNGEFLDMIPNAPIGLWPDLEYEGEQIDTILGRPLFIYTDGLNEAENRQQEQFGDERLLDFLRTTHCDSAKQLIEALTAKVEEHRNGAEPNDDLTMMSIRVGG